MDNLSPWIAFTGGLLSLLSPCVFPLIPVYLASLCGPEIFETGVSGRRIPVFFHSLCFVLGFTIVFIIVGAGVGLVGFSIGRFGLTGKIAGGLMIAFGLFLLVAPRVTWLNYERRLAPSVGMTSGYLRSFVIGLVFSLAWTPCVGPVLGGIMTLAFGSESPWSAGYLLAMYSLGMGLPFLIIGLAFDSLAKTLKRIQKYSSYIYIVSGLLLIAMGILTMTNNLQFFSVGF